MEIIFAIISFIFLFLGLCIVVLLSFTLTNIFTKSYSSKNATIIILFLLALFLINGLMLFYSYTQLVSKIKENSSRNDVVELQKF